MSNLNALLRCTITRFAQYPVGWVCASTDLPLQAFVDACNGSASFTAEIQDDYWCVIRPINPNKEWGGTIIWRPVSGSPRVSDLQVLKERFFSYVKQKEEAK